MNENDQDSNIVPSGPVVVLFLDGWGVAPPGESNLLYQARTPVWDDLVSSYPATVLKTHGPDMGFYFNEKPDLETGYYIIGTSRPYNTNLNKINSAIEDNSFFQNKTLVQAIEHTKNNQSKLHFVGLASEANIHSSLDHLRSLLSLAKQNNVKEVYLHLILDGVDVPDGRGKDYIKQIQQYKEEFGIGKIASISGRYYAMDRDNHWERTAKAYHAITQGEGRKSLSPEGALEESYSKYIFDKEFFPTVITDEKGTPISTVESGDGVILFNTRGDRVRQLAQAFTLPGMEVISNRKVLEDLYFASFSECGYNTPVHVAFPTEETGPTLGGTLQKNNITQLRLASSEKYGHITFSLDGGKELSDPNREDRIISVENEIMLSYSSDEIISAIKEQKYRLIMCNFPTPDRETDQIPYKDIIKSIESIDASLERIYKETVNRNGVLILTSSIGKLESLFNPQTETYNTEYSNQEVPFLLVGNKWEGKTLQKKDVPGEDLSIITPKYSLLDITPTLLKLLGISKPKEMKGKSVL